MSIQFDTEFVVISPKSTDPAGSGRCFQTKITTCDGLRREKATPESRVCTQRQFLTQSQQWTFQPEMYGNSTKYPLKPPLPMGLWQRPESWPHVNASNPHLSPSSPSSLANRTQLQSRADTSNPIEHHFPLSQKPLDPRSLRQLYDPRTSPFFRCASSQPNTAEQHSFLKALKVDIRSFHHLVELGHFTVRELWRLSPRQTSSRMVWLTSCFGQAANNT